MLEFLVKVIDWITGPPPPYSFYFKKNMSDYKDLEEMIKDFAAAKERETISQLEKEKYWRKIKKILLALGLSAVTILLLKYLYQIGYLDDILRIVWEIITGMGTGIASIWSSSFRGRKGPNNPLYPPDPPFNEDLYDNLEDYNTNDSGYKNYMERYEQEMTERYEQEMKERHTNIMNEKIKNKYHEWNE